MRIIFFALIFFFVNYFASAQSKEEEGTKKAWYQCSKIVVKNEGIPSTKYGKLFFDINTKLTPNPSKKKEFDWLTNYPRSYFTAHLINASDSIVKIERQDGSLIMIQEAKNEEGEWVPIEHWLYSWCGNSYMNPLVLEHGQKVMIPIKKYSGTFETVVRLKLKIGEVLVYSDPFISSIDLNQFKKVYVDGSGEFHHANTNYLED
jgi:hypothetical protein